MSRPEPTVDPLVREQLIRQQVARADHRERVAFLVFVAFVVQLGAAPS